MAGQTMEDVIGEDLTGSEKRLKMLKVAYV